MLICGHAAAGEDGEVFIAPKPAHADLPAEAVAFPMKIEGDRAFVTAKIGEASCSCLIDTGAELTLVNKARVKLKDVRVTGTEQLNGAFVGGISVQKAVLPSLQLGSSAHADVAVGLIDHREGQKLGQFEAILGFDFLGRARFTLDYARGRMILWPVQGALPEPAAGVERVRLPLHKPLGEALPRVEGVVNGKARASFLVDTGAGGPYFVAFKKPAEYGLELGAECGRMRFGGEKNGCDLVYYASVAKRLEFGKLVLEDQPLKVLDASQGVGASVAEDLRLTSNLIGTPLLRRFDAVTFDAPNKCIYFDRAAPEPATPAPSSPRP
ncbi:MAG: aspartyl protease family protein [Planctomycetota bacterium]|nr:aspartyl protease family protein [Planctomycetota bacterium]